MRTRRIASLVIVAATCAAACTTTTTTGSGTTVDDPGAPADLLHQRGAAADAIAAIERAVGATPSRVVEAVVYPEYLVVEAQDPDILDHIDEYTWRDGEVGAPEAVQLTGPQEEVDASLFPTSLLRWRRLAAMVAAAERAALENEPLRIESPRASYVIVERSASPDDDGRVLVRIYISGPRRSGYVEMATDGEIRSVTVH